MRGNNGAAAMNIFENERNILFVNGKTAINTQNREREKKPRYLLDLMTSNFTFTMQQVAVQPFVKFLSVFDGKGVCYRFPS
jgi:hypothetical protein